jgi:hypothetical protein
MAPARIVEPVYVFEDGHLGRPMGMRREMHFAMTGYLLKVGLLAKYRLF